MQLKEKFIRATENYNTLDDHVPAYYFRGSFLFFPPLTGRAFAPFRI